MSFWLFWLSYVRAIKLTACFVHRVGLLLNDAFAAMQTEGTELDTRARSGEDLARPDSPPMEKGRDSGGSQRRDSGGFGSEFGGSLRGSAMLSQMNSSAHGSGSESGSGRGSIDGAPSRPPSAGARPSVGHTRFAQIQMEAQVVDGDVATQTLPGPSDVGLELGQICDSEDADDAALDVASFMHRSPLAVQADFPATRVYSMFTTLALRHLTVTDAGNRVLGIVTRKDVMAAVDRSH